MRSPSATLRICLWCVAATLVEVALFVSYRGHDARFHWFTHFFVGASVALVVMALVARRQRRPVAYPLVWPVLGHVVAMFPDLLFAGGEAHAPWMDVFLGHISTHFVPGRNLTWFVVFLAALGLYLTQLDSIRDDDRRVGATTLHVRRWGEGQPVLFLHGLGASSRYWDRLAAATSGYEGIAPDLLGFGRSPKPRHAAYDVEAHLEALDPLLVPGTVIVGHSTGAVLAAALAAAPPVALAGVVLIGLPAYPDADTARREISRLGVLARFTVTGNPLGWLVCTLMCIVRPVAVLVGPLLIRDLPPAIVADGARHSWRSYSRTLQRVVVEHRTIPDLTVASVQACLVHGSADREAPITYARQAAAAAGQAGAPVSLEEVDGDHHIAVRAPEQVGAFLQRFVASDAAATDA
ncbi:MAG: alpha/beta hydrolase [Actinobacteria bacterium]|nr:alpha/beta hydrolase [Actinomycetota bacterium]